MKIAAKNGNEQKERRKAAQGPAEPVCFARWFHLTIGPPNRKDKPGHKPVPAIVEVALLTADEMSRMPKNAAIKQPIAFGFTCNPHYFS